MRGWRGVEGGGPAHSQRSHWPRGVPSVFPAGPSVVLSSLSSTFWSSHSAHMCMQAWTHASGCGACWCAPWTTGILQRHGVSIKLVPFSSVLKMMVAVSIASAEGAWSSRVFPGFAVRWSVNRRSVTKSSAGGCQLSDLQRVTVWRCSGCLHFFNVIIVAADLHSLHLWRHKCSVQVLLLSLGLTWSQFSLYSDQIAKWITILDDLVEGGSVMFKDFIHWGVSEHVQQFPKLFLQQCYCLDI